ncbi:MAG: glycosyltransferase [Endomicrobium sp.]|jgi:glycosyltransferase involved in cell wall biosynthesis|nr:glycosyltransferase [Endomicrobium sp.]
MPKPKISLVCPSYNHGKFIGAFLDGIINQTEQDFEIIIVDDASKDDNTAVVKKYADDRIKLIENDYNRGLAYSFTKGCRAAQADIVAFTPTDDVYFPQYLYSILEKYKDGEADAVFIAMKYIDEKGKALEGSWTLPVQKSQKEIFLHYFLKGPILATNGMSFKKTAIEKLLPLDYGVIQYLDTQLHFNFLFNNKVAMLNRPLVLNRVFSQQTSARNNETLLRESIETEKLMETVISLIGGDIKNFDYYFGDFKILQNREIYPETIPFWIARLAMQSDLFDARAWGYKKIMNFISCENNLDILHKKYGFDFGTYLNLAKEVSAGNPAVKIKKYRKRLQRTTFVFIIILCSLLLIIWFL